MRSSGAWKSSALLFVTSLLVGSQVNEVQAQQNAITGPGTIGGAVRWAKKGAEPTSGPNTRTRGWSARSGRPS